MLVTIAVAAAPTASAAPCSTGDLIDKAHCVIDQAVPTITYVNGLIDWVQCQIDCP